MMNQDGNEPITISWHSPLQQAGPAARMPPPAPSHYQALRPLLLAAAVAAVASRVGVIQSRAAAHAGCLCMGASWVAAGGEG